VRLKHPSITERGRGVLTLCASPTVLTDSGGSDLSDARLGFSSFAVVKRRLGDSLITTYRAATLPLSRSFLPANLAADPTACPDFPTLLNSSAMRATTLSKFLSARTLSGRSGFQQLLAIKVTLSKRDYQQHFSLTPSRGLCLFIRSNLHELSING
jgi:hypothetical protein